MARKKPPFWTPEKHKIATDMAAAGKTYREIGVALGVSVHSAINHCSMRGIKAQREQTTTRMREAAKAAEMVKPRFPQFEDIADPDCDQKRGRKPPRADVGWGQSSAEWAVEG